MFMTDEENASAKHKNSDLQRIALDSRQAGKSASNSMIMTDEKNASAEHKNSAKQRGAMFKAAEMNASADYKNSVKQRIALDPEQAGKSASNGMVCVGNQLHSTPHNQDTLHQVTKYRQCLLLCVDNCAIGFTKNRGPSTSVLGQHVAFKEANMTKRHSIGRFLKIAQHIISNRGGLLDATAVNEITCLIFVERKKQNAQAKGILSQTREESYSALQVFLLANYDGT